MQITFLKKEHINQIILLSNNSFGEGFLNNHFLNQFINSSQKIGFVSLENKKVIGYILFETLTQGKFIDEVLLEKDWFDYNFKDQDKVQLIRQILVSKHYQNKGIASQLIKESLNQTNNSLNTTCCIAWKKEDSPFLQNILLKTQFDFNLTIANYWHEDSIIKNYTCSVCGTPPCNCSAEVYIRKIKNP